MIQTSNVNCSSIAWLSNYVIAAPIFFKKKKLYTWNNGGENVTYTILEILFESQPQIDLWGSKEWQPDIHTWYPPIQQPNPIFI